MLNTGELLINMRQLSKMQQKDIADALGVTATYLSLLEHNKREPSFTLVRKYCKLIGVNISIKIIKA